MASNDTAARLTERHRSEVLAVRARTLGLLSERWPVWSVDDPGSFDLFIDDVARLTRAGHDVTARLARDYYRDFAVAETGSRAAPAVIDRLDSDRLLGSLRGEGLGSTVKALRAGSTPAQARQLGLVNLSGASGQMVTQGSYSTVVESVVQDPQALGWARTTSSKPCAFCALMAARGPVYRTSSSADFKAHKACACGAEPVYDRGTEWPGRAREFEQTYQEAVAGARQAGELQRGTSNDLLNAFRRAYEAQ